MRASQQPARPVSVDGAGGGGWRAVLPWRSWQGRKGPTEAAGSRTGREPTEVSELRRAAGGFFNLFPPSVTQLTDRTPEGGGFNAVSQNRCPAYEEADSTLG